MQRVLALPISPGNGIDCRSSTARFTKEEPGWRTIIHWKTSQLNKHCCAEGRRPCRHKARKLLILALQIARDWGVTGLPKELWRKNFGLGWAHTVNVCWFSYSSKPTFRGYHPMGLQCGVKIFVLVHWSHLISIFEWGKEVMEADCKGWVDTIKICSFPGESFLSTI